MIQAGTQDRDSIHREVDPTSLLAETVIFTGPTTNSAINKPNLLKGIAGNSKIKFNIMLNLVWIKELYVELL